MEKQIIFFDVDGVLVHGYHARTELRKCWDENIERDFGINRERFAKEFIFGPFIQSVIVGTTSLQEELKNWLPKFGYNGDPQIFLDYWLQKDANENSALIAQIKRLKEKADVRLFIATNQEHNRAKYLMEQMGFASYFEDIFYSARVGARKPDRAYFDWISHRLNITGQQKPIFFDDTPAVVKAARDYGWEAIEFLDVNDLYQSSYIRGILEQDLFPLRAR
jgi:putative hydrolase of the HAD superfamily